MIEPRDDTELQRISPEVLRDFLRGEGWEFHEPYGQYAEIYVGPSGNKALVPSLQESEFYPKRVRELLSVVVPSDDVHEPALFNDIRYHGRYVAHLVAPTESGRDTLPPGQFVSLAAGARQVWEGVVTSVGLDSTQQAEYWETAGFGHTESGSFVLTICGPLFEQLGLAPAGQARSNAQKVTDQLRTTVEATRFALSELRQGNDIAFPQATERGITLDTCEGISKTVQHIDEVRWEIRSSDGTGYSNRKRTKHRFDRSDVPYLDRVVEMIRSRSWVKDPKPDEAVGYIKKFEKPQHQEEAKATMTCVFPRITGTQTVHIALTPDQYETAWKLHKSDLNAIATGTFERTGARTWELRDTQIGRAPIQSDSDDAV